MAKRVFVTGAAGRIGSWFAQHASEQFELTLMVDPDRDEDTQDLEPHGKLVHGKLEALPQLAEMLRGHDALLHLAADPSPNAGWESLLPNNIIGAYNAFTAARQAGVRRVVYASSIHAVSGYAVDHQARETDAPHPGDLYGVTKAFGEAMAAYVSTHEEMTCIAVRIGAFQPARKAEEPGGVRLLDSFVSRRDLCQLLVRCLKVQGVRYAVVHGISDNRYKRLDLQLTRQLTGYAPEDDVARENPDLHAAGVDKRLEHRGT